MTSNPMDEARKFYIANPTEKKTTVAKIFNVNVNSLKSAINRDYSLPRGGHNRILDDSDTKAIHERIKSYLMHGILPTSEIVFNMIVALKRARDPTSVGPTRRWFRAWWKASGIHKIKIKPLAMERFEAVEESEIYRWFGEYRSTLKCLGIRSKRNIVNFDEAGFRIGCMASQEILVPDEIKEFYVASPENRRSLTMIENVNAAGDYPIPSFVIVSGQEIMASWYSEDLSEGTRIVTSETGFTSDAIAIEWLNHFIEHSGAGGESDWKLLLMDNHGSHMTPEFQLLANEHHIRPFTFIPHMTHFMQPLDVGVFKQYKHYHQKAIQEAIAVSYVEYSVVQFLKDLTKIRNNTFKADTIRHSFEDSGMWPINASKCIEKMKTFRPDPPQASAESLSALPALPRYFHPRKIADVEHGLEKWGAKIQRRIEWSDPVREGEFDSFLTDSRKVITNSILNEEELKMWHKRRDNELHGRKINRKRLRPQHGGLGLTKENALAEIAIKQQKEEEAEKKRVENNFMKMWRMERDEVHTKGVAARKAERARIKQLREMRKGYAPIPPELEIPIPDPEAEWKATNQVWKSIEAKKTGKKFPDHINEEDEEEVEINVDRPTALWDQDFIPLDEAEDEETQFLPGDWRDRMAERDEFEDEEVHHYLMDCNDYD